MTMADLHLLVLCFVVYGAVATEVPSSAVDLAWDMYEGCIQHVSVSCVKPKALAWISRVVDKDVINVTEDLSIVKNKETVVEERKAEDIYDHLEDFLATHRLVAKVPSDLRPGGSLNEYLPRSFVPEDVSIPLAATGRSKVVKKVIIPFLLGLKFKTAILVPLALALIALKSWKALTLGLLSLVLTGAMLIFKLSKPKVATYEVIHYPQHHVEHIEHAAPAGWDHHGAYGRQLDGNDLAYRAYLN